MKTTIDRRVALITGANRGIGLQTAKDLGSDGVILLLGVRSVAKAEAAVETLRKEGFEITSCTPSWKSQVTPTGRSGRNDG